jgi:hypothetical protein
MKKRPRDPNTESKVAAKKSFLPLVPRFNDTPHTTLPTTTSLVASATTASSSSSSIWKNLEDVISQLPHFRSSVTEWINVAISIEDLLSRLDDNCHDHDHTNSTSISDTHEHAIRTIIEWALDGLQDITNAGINAVTRSDPIPQLPFTLLITLLDHFAAAIQKSTPTTSLVRDDRATTLNRVLGSTMTNNMMNMQPTKHLRRIMTLRDAGLGIIASGKIISVTTNEVEMSSFIKTITKLCGLSVWPSLPSSSSPPLIMSVLRSLQSFHRVLVMLVHHEWRINQIDEIDDSLTLLVPLLNHYCSSLPNNSDITISSNDTKDDSTDSSQTDSDDDDSADDNEPATRKRCRNGHSPSKDMLRELTSEVLSSIIHRLQSSSRPLSSIVTKSILTSNTSPLVMVIQRDHAHLSTQLKLNVIRAAYIADEQADKVMTEMAATSSLSSANLDTLCRTLLDHYFERSIHHWSSSSSSSSSSLAIRSLCDGLFTPRDLQKLLEHGRHLPCMGKEQSCILIHRR